MDKLKVKELMVPVGEMPTVNLNDDFTTAVEGLARVLEDFKAGKRKSRTLLVVDEHEDVVGKITPTDILRSLEPSYARLLDKGVSAQVSKFGYLIDSLREEIQHATHPWTGMCSRIKGLKVKDFIKSPPQSQIIQADETMDEAIHRFVLAKHDALFVTDGKNFVGLLGLSVVYEEIVERIKNEC